MLPPGLESKHIGFLNLCLCGVLDQYDAFLVRDEFRQDIRKRRLPTRSGPTDEDVLPVGGIFGQLLSEACP